MDNKIGIIGLGRVGMSLYSALLNEGYKYVETYTRSDGKDISGVIRNSDIIFVCAGDDDLEGIAGEISNKFSLLNGKSFVHFSGFRSSRIFDRLRAKGAKAASFHPVQTFPTKGSFMNMYNIYFSFEGDDIKDELEDIFMCFDPVIICIDEKQKCKYHAAAVFSSNLLCALLDISDSLLKEAGIKEGVKIHEKLISATVENIIKMGTWDALTGPAARGDLSTITEHMKSLRPADSSIYKLLTIRALSIARIKNPYKNVKYSSIEKELLNNDCK